MYEELRGPGREQCSKMAAPKHGSRKFYEIPSEKLQHLKHSDNRKVKERETVEELFMYIEKSCIGKDVTFAGPYGLQKSKHRLF